MKKILIIITIAISFFACNYLDFEPEGSVPAEGFYETKEQAEQSVVAMYGRLRSWELMGGLNYQIIGELTSDNVTKGSSPGDGSYANAYHQYTFGKGEGQIEDYWRNRYTAVSLSNEVLENIPNMTDVLSENEIKRYVADAKFMRGFHYFYLIRAFGGIILNETSVSGKEEYKPRATLEDSYLFVEKDLKDAIKDLPTSVSGKEGGRATSWAAMGMLAKVYLYQKDWEGVRKITDTIINHGGFDLYPNFWELFRQDKEFCQESLFEVVATEIAGNEKLSNCQYSEIQGPRDDGGWGWMAPTDNLAKAFDDAGDVVRKKATIIYKGDITPEGDTIKGVDRLEFDSIPRYSGKAYEPRKTRRQSYGRGQNIRMIRFAEILLMRAEAEFHLGGDASAPLNRVRGRVGLDPIASPTLEDIYLERRLELALEQDRFFDLVRTGQAATVLAGQGFIAGKHDLLPIPEKEIRKSAGTLTQNPGW